MVTGSKPSLTTCYKETREKLYAVVDCISERRKITNKSIGIDAEPSPGLYGTLYFDLLAEEDAKMGVYVIDQPDDQISQVAIKKHVLGAFKRMSANRQVLMITHNPLFVVNLDVDNVIVLARGEDGKIDVKSGLWNTNATTTRCSTLWPRPLKGVPTLSGNDSSAMTQKACKVGLKDGKIAIEKIDGFSIDVEDPKLNVGKLYSALFADVNEPTTISLEPAIELKQDRKAFSFFESLKKIVDGACEKMNPGLAEIAKKVEGLDADDEAKQS